MMNARKRKQSSGRSTGKDRRRRSDVSDDVRDEDVFYDDERPQKVPGMEIEEDNSDGETAAEKRLRIGAMSRTHHRGVVNRSCHAFNAWPQHTSATMYFIALPLAVVV
jgi:hypothetical protein